MGAIAGTRPHKVALLSFHSHGDRSFLDDQRLALLSGDLAAEGIENEYFLCALDPSTGVDDPVLAALRQRLAAFDVVVYDRSWDDAILESLRGADGGPLLIWCMNEHRQPGTADWICSGEQRDNLPALIRYLRGQRDAPPPETRPALLRLGEKAPETSPVPPATLAYAPNLRPTILGPERLPADRTFSLVGNAGCPYQADARENPLYSGVELPTRVGRGCAFCTTGNEYIGSPATKTAASVLEQLRYVRRHAPELDRLVLKDQNPFAYLTELIQAAAAEGLGPFTLMLETRADWFLRSRTRIEDALPAAQQAGIVLAPFLVGIENFSQRELDRLNKGVDAATNERFLHAIRELARRFPASFSLEEASFGFLMFTPWTTVADLRENRDAIVRTRFDELRGSLVVSRARLYPDTALFHLAKRDGLLTDTWTDGLGDNAARYGYHASHPWRFQDPVVAVIAKLGALASDRLGSRDPIALLNALLDVVPAAADPAALTVETILEKLKGSAGNPRADWAPADPAFLDKLAKLVDPIRVAGEGAGARITNVLVRPGAVRLALADDQVPPIEVELLGGRQEPAFAHTRGYSVGHAGRLVPGQAQLLRTLVDTIRRHGG